MSLFDLSNKVALVTGGNGGIGYAISESLGFKLAKFVPSAVAQRITPALPSKVTALVPNLLILTFLIGLSCPDYVSRGF